MDEIDLESVVERVLPWDHPVKLGGKVYATRPATIGEVAILEDAIRNKHNRTTSDLLEILTGIFVGKAKPDVGSMGPQRLKKLTEEYLRFFGQWQRLCQAPVATLEAAAAQS